MSHDHHGTRRVGQVKEVTSLSNPIVKDIKALSDKKHRDETKSFMAEGLKHFVSSRCFLSDSALISLTIGFERLVTSFT